MIDPHDPQPVLRIAASDWHRHDGPDCRSRSDQLLNWAEAWMPMVERDVYLLGDIAEMQLASAGSGMRGMTPIVLMVAQHLFRHHPLAHLVYVAGNHDERLGEMLRGAGQIYCYDRGTAPIRIAEGLYITHGDQYDAHTWIFDVLDRVQWRGSSWLGRLARRFDRRTGRNNGGLEYHRTQAIKVIKALPEGSVLLHGHTHMPTIQHLPGDRTWIDCGSAVDGGVWFAAQTPDGKWHLQRWTR